MIILNIFGIFFLIGAIHWLQKLSDTCECSADWRRTYLFYYYYLAILLNILAVKYNNPYLLGLMLALTTAAAAITLSYLVDLRKKQCRCIASNEKILFGAAVAQVIVTGILVVSFVYNTVYKDKTVAEALKQPARLLKSKA
jgi:hypothetical protein